MIREFRSGLIHPDDGAFAIAHARRAEALALNELSRIVRIYVDLVIDGKVPPQYDDEALGLSPGLRQTVKTLLTVR